MTELLEETKEKLNKIGKPIEAVTLNDLFPEKLSEDGLDFTLMTNHEGQIFLLYIKIRDKLKKKYPGQAPCRENDFDPYDINIAEARQDSDAHLFVELMCKMQAILDKIRKLQLLATENEKS